MSRWPRWGPLLLLVALGGCLQSASIDEPARDFSIDTLSHGRVMLSELEGRVVLLNFWGTWCGPCRAEVPGLVKLHDELEPRGLTILAINVGDEPAVLKRFVEGHSMRFPVAADHGVARLYGVDVFPTSIVVDRRGRVRHRSAGSLFGSVKGLRRAVEELLADPVPAASRPD